MSIQVLIGTTSGNTEFLAESLADRLHQHGLSTQIHDQPNLNEVPSKDVTWLVCLATHGAGEYAESIDQFMQQLREQRPNLSQVKIAMVSVGDSSYDTFCQAGIDAETLLSDLNAEMLCDRLDIDMLLDLDPEATANDWLQQIIDRL